MRYETEPNPSLSIRILEIEPYISNRDFSSRTEQLAGSPITTKAGGGGGLVVGLSMISSCSDDGGAHGRRRFEIRAGVLVYV